MQAADFVRFRLLVLAPRPGVAVLNNFGCTKSTCFPSSPGPDGSWQLVIGSGSSRAGGLGPDIALLSRPNEDGL